MRPLFPHEIGQIAGRAGRYLSPGTFGVTGEARPFDDETVDAVENHRFAPIQRLNWRNPDLQFGTVARLVAALEAASGEAWLPRGRQADDVPALKTLAEMPEVAARIAGPQDVKRLWEVCGIPDFRTVSPAEHAALLARIYGFLADPGHVPDDWLAAQIARARPQRRRHRYPVEAAGLCPRLGPMSRNAAAGSAMKAIGAARRAL